MSKELETLEELKDLKNAFVGHCKELKCETNYIKVCENKFSNIENSLKALKIIKEYEVDYFYLKLTFNAYKNIVIGCERYNERCQNNRTACRLPLGKYYFLKEVLL